MADSTCSIEKYQNNLWVSFTPYFGLGDDTSLDLLFPISPSSILSSFSLYNRETRFESKTEADMILHHRFGAIL
jgi:hypothetical protein